MDIRSLLDTLTQLDTSIEEAPKQRQGGGGKRQRDYQLAQQQMANLEKAAQYTGDDPIVRQRMGLPAKLPSIDQWDGKMPEPTGQPDWLAKLGSGFKLDRDAQGNIAGATSNATTAQQQAVAQNKGLSTSAKFVDQILPKIKAILHKADGKGDGTGSGRRKTMAAAPGAGGYTGFGGAEESYGSIASELVREFGYDEFEMPIVEAELTPQEEKELADLMSQISDIEDPRIQRVQKRYQNYLKNIKGKAAPAAGAAKPGAVSAQGDQEFSKDLDTILQLLQKKSGGAAQTRAAAPAAAPAGPTTITNPAQAKQAAAPAKS